MLVKIFSEPSAVFNSIRTKASWAVPITLVILVAIISGYVSFPYTMEMQVQRLEQKQNISQDQLDAARKSMESMKDSPIVAGISSVVQGIFFGVFIVIGAALYMLMGTVLMGGSARFVQVLSVSLWSMIPMLLGMLIKIPLVLSKGSLDVRTSLALLMPNSSILDPAVATLNSVTDIFTIWAMILAIIGIAIVYKFSKGKAAVVVLVPAAVLAGIGFGIGKLFGG